MKKTKVKKKRVRKTLFWTPRILAIVFAVFISIFALDVFGESYTFWEALLGFLIHLVPTYLIVISLIVAWKWEHIGGFIFIFLGLWYILMTHGKFNLLTYLIIPLPLIFIGILFILNKYLKK